MDLELSKSTLVEEIILSKFHPTLKRLNRPCAKLNMITSPHTDYAYKVQGCIFRLTCSYPELTEDHVLTSAYVKIFRTVTRNAVNKSV